MARRGAFGPWRAKTQILIERIKQFARAERSDLGGRQLDRQWEAVQ